MGRKSIAPLRKEEILDAFERCIGNYGFANSTTRKIAEEAGINQPMIAHYFGNKDTLVTELMNRIVSQYVSRLQQEAGDTTGDQRIHRILDFLFGPGLLGPDAKGDLIGQLISASVNNKRLRTQIKLMYQSFLAIGEKELHSIYPEAETAQINRCVYGILCLAVGNDALLSTDISYSNRKYAQSCAEALIAGIRH